MSFCIDCPWAAEAGTTMGDALEHQLATGHRGFTFRQEDREQSRKWHDANRARFHEFEAHPEATHGRR